MVLSLITTPWITKTVLTKISSSIITPHGVIDVAHAVVNNDLFNYTKLMTTGLGFAGVTDTFDPHALISMLFLFSAIHWRHQFNLILKNELYSLIASYSFALWASIYPYYTLLFMVLIHVPHQYYEHREEMKANDYLGLKLSGILIGASLFIDTEIMTNWYSNPWIIGFIIGHILYQEKIIKDKGETNSIF